MALLQVNGDQSCANELLSFIALKVKECSENQGKKNKEEFALSK